MPQYTHAQYAVAVDQFCSAAAITSNSRRAYRHVLRRALRHFDPTDFAALVDYDATLRQGSRNVLRSAWRGWRQFLAVHAVAVPDIPAKQHSRYAPPIAENYAKFTALGQLSSDIVAESTFANIQSTPLGTALVYDDRAFALSPTALMCLQLMTMWTYPTGPQAHYPLVPTKPNGQRPMPAWRLRHMVNQWRENQKKGVRPEPPTGYYDTLYGSSSDAAASVESVGSSTLNTSDEVGGVYVVR